MKNLKHISGWAAALAIVGIVATSCNDKRSRTVEFMPDMYRSEAYETYAPNPFNADSVGARKPVAGTIPRGFMPYEIPNTDAGYLYAYENLKNPLEATDEVLKEGKELYAIFCTHCHGDKGDGNGVLVQNEKFLGVPSYGDPGRTINEGSTFHVITYGKGVMGSHASQVTQQERWKIVHHVMELKEALMPKAETESNEAATE